MCEILIEIREGGNNIRFIDLCNQRFGKLTVQQRVEDHVDQNGRRRVRYRCLCDCGNEIITQARNLRSGDTVSCGCVRKSNLTEGNVKHGMSKSRLYRTWRSMKRRCTDKHRMNYADYGGRGIKVCEEWASSFETFMVWANENGYDDSLTIDRVDCDGSYSPENCRWATSKMQNNNTRRNVRITYDNQTHTIAEWADLLNIKYDTLYKRISQGWPYERAFSKIAHTR